MRKLWVYENFSVQLYLLKGQDKEMTIGLDKSNSIVVKRISLKQKMLSLQWNELKDCYDIYEGSEKIGSLGEGKPFIYDSLHERLVLTLTGQETESLYYIETLPAVRFATTGECEILLETVEFDSMQSFTLYRDGKKWKVDPEKETRLYLNGKKLVNPSPLKDGDLLIWPGMTICIQEGTFLKLSASAGYESSLTETALPVSEMKLHYPFFHRTPRLIYDLPKEKVDLTFPGQDTEDDQKGLWLIILPPLVMLIIMGIVAMVNPRGIFMLISVAMFTTTIFTSSIQYFRDKKKTRLKKERRFRVYKRYLESKREELDQYYQKQRDVTYFHNPSFEEMKRMVAEISDRIWERTIEHDDFLQLRIGRADLPASYKISLNSTDMSNREIDSLLEESQELEKAYRNVHDIPLSIQLSSGSVGLVGKRSIVMKELQQLVSQLAFFHSYHDIRFINIFEESEYKNWEWMKWFPHFQLPYSYAKGFIYNQTARDQLLTSIYQTIRERDFTEDKEKKIFMPHYVFIVSDRNLIAEHVIMEYLEGKKDGLGITTIFVSDTKENLTENLNTLVQYINEREGEILIENKKAVHQSFRLDDYSREGIERYARTLGSLQHRVGMNNSIPEMVSFLQLLGAEDVEDLNLEGNWNSSQTSQSLSVPIGLKGKSDQAVLNLHEKAHGPHGLVAGTTGSGKSEMLQTYILSMAVHFHPHDVAFLLIDYKGGGMALPFKNMPHLLGTITNIEGSKNFSNRALASINSELKKRQRLFGAFNVNHIDDYTELYKQGAAETALPHLFLICDEFAELKNEEPEFIKELVSAARIGRSLGVHLILATQKPGGVIDNQIWSNARFRIALKVQDESDSREVLKNGDAANITITGRGYLQVGNNEVYELFQSAWSGAPYAEETFGGEDEVALITDLGLVQLSEVSTNSKKKTDKVTEIDAVVNHILAEQERLGIKQLPSPWLQPLENRLLPPEPVAAGDEWFNIALKDEPEKQEQSNYKYHWINDGSILIFGSSGYGKSMTTLTLLTQFASAYSPEDLHYYIFDFGNGSLLPLKTLSHTADYFRIDEDRKIDKFFTFMKKEIDSRKQLFTDKEVSSISLYNSLYPEEKLPILFIVIDNYDLVKEELFDTETMFTQFARDGQSLGIFFLITATRVNVIRQPLMNSFKTKIFHYLIDNSELYGVLGRPPFEQEPVPGRAMIRKDETFFSQVFLPAEGENDVELIQSIRSTISKLNNRYEGIAAPRPIPMLSSALSLLEFEEMLPSMISRAEVPIGLCEEDVTPVSIHLQEQPHFLVMGQFRKGKSNALKVMLHMLMKNPLVSFGIYDNVDRNLSGFKEHDNAAYINSKEELTEFLQSVEERMKEREKHYFECLKNNKELPVYEKIVFIIDGYSRFQQNSDTKNQEMIASFMKQYSHLGFSVIAAGNANEFSKGFDGFTNELKQIRQGLILMKKSDQNLFTLPFTRNEKEVQPGFGYYVVNGKERLIQIPLY